MSFSFAHTFKNLGCSLALCAVALTAQAQAITPKEITLKAVSSFSKDLYFNQKFERFVKAVNEQGKGLVQINLIGGPEAMPAFEGGNALKAGVVDMINSTGVFITNVVPESLALSFSPVPMKTIRANGGYELMNQIHREKGNMVWLGRTTAGIKYHVYTNKKPASTNLDTALGGMKLRSVPIYRAFFQSLGATPLQVPPGEVYTALERGVVDGYGWPSIGVFDMGWQEKTRYRIDPGFYSVEVSIFVNRNTWDKMSDAQRQFLREQMQKVEDAAASEDRALAVKEEAQLRAAGIEIIKLDDVDAAAFVARANEHAWKTIEQTSPKYGKQLRGLFSGQ